MVGELLIMMVFGLFVVILVVFGYNVLICVNKGVVSKLCCFVYGLYVYFVMGVSFVLLLMCDGLCFVLCVVS